MNIIKNKDFLRNIAQQLDLFNTLGGGISETHVRVKQGQQEAVIEVWAAGVSPEAFNVILNSSYLLVSSNIYSEHNPDISAPIFSRTFMLPPTVNLDLIEATYEDGRLCIRLPYHESADKPRVITIKQL